jgi:hypothetical protein
MLKPAEVEFAPPVIPAPLVATHVKFVFRVVDVKEILTLVLEQIVSLLTKVASAFGDGFTVIT